MQKELNNSSLSLLLSNIENNRDSNLLSSTFSNIKKIDKGGFGILYKATHILDLKNYAIKKITLLKENNEVFCINIYNKLREVRCLSVLNHKNIIRYNTSWIEKIQKNTLQEINIYIQMELMDINLKDYLLTKINKPINKKHIIKNIIFGLFYLHSQKIIHCDLKPDNILLNLENDNIQDVKIADFGLVIEKDIKESRNMNYGNFIYIPPDNDLKIYTFHYDIYSLGVIIFEIIEEWKTNMEKFEKIMKFKSGYYKEKYPILTTMISKKNEERPDINFIKDNIDKII
jgi:serine/threonine protein kinase